MSPSNLDLPRLRSLPVILPSGEELPLSALWPPGPLLLVFLRHFGCVGCSQNVSQLTPRLWELKRLGVETLLLGNGNPAQLQAFAAAFNLGPQPLTIATDPSLACYAAAGLERSFGATFRLKSAWDLLRGLSRGHLNRLPRGDLLQQGGTFLFDAERRLVLAHKDYGLSDYLPAVEVLEAALRLALASLQEG